MKKNSKAGFTLIEVLISLIIICLMFSGISRMIISNLKVKKLTEEKYIVMNWTQSVIEYIKTLNLEDYQGEYTAQDFPHLRKYRKDFPQISKLINEVLIVIDNYPRDVPKEKLYQIYVCARGNIKGKMEIYELATLVYND